MRGVCAHFLAWQSTKLVRVIKTLWAQTFFSTPLGWGCGIKKTYPLARLGGASIDSGKRFGGKRFCCELPAGPGPGAARRAREAKRSPPSTGAAATLPPPRALRPRRTAREEWSTCLAYVSADVPQPIAQYRRGRRRAPAKSPAFPRWARAVAAQASGVAVLVARLVVNSHQRKGLGAAF